jgi:hypothetical protein
LEYIHELKKEYGSVLSFIQKHRLFWDNVTPSGDIPFSNHSDYKILHNDWPYHIDERITHLIVWTKFLINDDPVTEDVTDEDKARIESFIQKTFCSAGVGNETATNRDRIVWFRNWKSLKSVHALGKTDIQVMLSAKLTGYRAHTHHALQSTTRTVRKGHKW